MSRIGRRFGPGMALAALIGLAGLSLGRVYNGYLLIVLVAGAGIGSVLVSAALPRAPGWAVAPMSVGALAAYAVLAVVVSAQASGVRENLSTVALDAARNLLPRLLSALIPVEPQPDTVLGPVVLAWLAGFVAAELITRARRPAAALIPPLLLYAGALVAVGPNAGAVLWHPLAFAGLAAFATMAGDASGVRGEPVKAVRDPMAGRLRRSGGPASGIAAVLAGAVAITPLVALAVRQAPIDPRRYVEPPTLDVLDQNPLIRLSGWAATPDQPLFEVAVLSGSRAGPTPTLAPGPTDHPAEVGDHDVPLQAETEPPAAGAYDTRLRLAVLSEWDGVTWRADGEYRNAGRVLPPVVAPPGVADATDGETTPSLEIVERITVEGLQGRLLPAVSAPRRVEGVRVAYAQATGTLLHADDIAPGLTYTVTSINPPVDVDRLPASDVPAGPAVASYLAVGDTVPADLAHLAELVSIGESSPYLRALALETFIAEHYRYAVDGPSGHAYPNLRFFLFENPRAGGQQGTSEQFATAFATLGRLMGLPTRVVVGFRTPAGGGLVTGADALAWPEVLFTDIGWVAFDPMPDADTPPGPLEDEYLPKPPPPTSPPASLEPPAEPTWSPPPSGASVAAISGGSGFGVVAGGAGAGLLVLLVVFAVAVGLVRAVRRRSRLDRGSPTHRVLGAWDEVLDALTLASAAPAAHLAVGEIADHAATVAESAPGRRHARQPRPAAPPLVDLAAKVNAVVFAGGASHSLGTSDELSAIGAKAQAMEYVRALRARRPWWRRLLWRVDPRPLWRRR